MPLRRRFSRKWWGLLAGGLGCGALVALSVPPFGFWPLGWLGLAGLTVLLPGRSLASRLAFGAGIGAGQYVIGLWWVQQFSIPGCVALMVLSSLFYVAALAVVPTCRRRYVAASLPALLVLADWARDRYPLGGLPLAGLALGQATSPLAPVLRLGGSLLLTGETVLASVALAEVFQAGRSWVVLRRLQGSSQYARRNAWRSSASAAGVAAAAVLVVVIALASPSGRGGHLPTMRVALVQGGGPRGTRAIHTDPEVPFDRELAASSSLLPPLDLVVWPEGMLQSDGPYLQTADAAAVSALAVRTGSTVVVGVEQDVGTRRYLNEVVAWAPDGQVADTYVKNHLVPFGEYVPDRSLVQRYFNVSDVPLDAIAGHGPGILRTPAGPLGVMISYEVFFDGRARGAVRAGGQVLVVPTNTASYRGGQVPAQEVAAARLRAQETGRWLLQVTPTGYTAVVSPTGRVVERTSLGSQQVLLATVPRQGGRTVYVDGGDVPIAVAALCLYLLCAGLARRERLLRSRR